MPVQTFSFDGDVGAIDAILDRVRRYDWSALPDIGGWEAGVDCTFLRRICARWVDGWSWPDARRRLSRHAQFRAAVGGQPIHFVRESPAARDGRPALLLLHGWPGSYLEYEQVVDGLVAAGLEVVVPSLPGYGFSTPLEQPIGPRATAGLLNRLMVEELGHARYVVHGGDWGSFIASWLGIDHAGTCAAVHLSMLSRQAESVRPETPDELAWAARRDEVRWAATGYFHQQSTRPQTLGVALADSPVGVAAWILEKYVTWSDLPSTPDGAPDVWAVYSEDELIDIVMLYLITNTIVTSTWMYYASAREPASFPTSLAGPVGFAKFRESIAIPPPRSLAERTYPIVQWLDMDHGGHFPGHEAPDLLSDALLRFVANPAVIESVG